MSLGDNGQCEVHGVETVLIKMLVNNIWQESRTENVLYVPSLRKNLFSVGICTSKGYDIVFKEKTVLVSSHGKLCSQGYKQDNHVYRMFFVVTSKSEASLETNISTVSLRVLHERMGHINVKTIQEMIKKNTIKDIELSNTDDFFCEACQFGKAHRFKFPKRAEDHRRNPEDYIHSQSDVCGPFPESTARLKYFVTFVDDASNYRQIYFLKHKSDVVERFREFNNQIANKFGRNIKVLKVDNGKEYCNDNMYSYLRSKGICMENTAPYTPEQNGKAERENRTIIESARTMLHAKNLPQKLWVEAVSTTLYILNRTISNKNILVTPYEIWTGEKPNISHLKVFESIAYVHINKQFRKKLDTKSKKTIFVGYQSQSKNYKLYDPKSQKIIISKDVSFNEMVEGMSESALGDNSQV